MRKTLHILLAVLITLSLSSALAAPATPTEQPVTDFSFVDSMPTEQIIALRDYCNTLISASASAPIAEGEEEIEIEATRETPALIGDRMLIDFDGAQIAVTVVNLFRGSSANMFAKSFNRYNTASYQMSKGTEWVLAYLKIEALSAEEDRIGISDYFFHMVSDVGIDLGNSYIADNPLPINDMYVNSTQYCWYGMFIPTGTKALLTIDGGYDGKTYWVDLSTRRQVDTAAMAYADIAKNDSGENVTALQYMLAEYGFLSKVPSGTFDSATISAIKKYQKAVGLAVTGAADLETQRRLFSGVPIQ